MESDSGSYFSLSCSPFGAKFLCSIALMVSSAHKDVSSRAITAATNQMMLYTIMPETTAMPAFIVVVMSIPV